MRFVLDASVAVAWAFAAEAHPAADAALVLIRNDEGCVPRLWWFEIRNVLIVNERRGRLRETDTALFLRNLARLPISTLCISNHRRLRTQAEDAVFVIADQRQSRVGYRMLLTGEGPGDGNRSVEHKPHQRL